MINTNSPYAIRVIYRKVDDYPIVMTLESMSDVYALLGFGTLRMTQIDDAIYVISRADAFENDEPLNLTDTYTEDDILCEINIYGDVVVVGYDPNLNELTGLTQVQIDAMMFTAEDIA